jgi:hypothetical protein
MKGALEAHRDGDTRKGPAMDGGRRTSTEKTSDVGPENKDKQEKTENNKEPTK